MVLPHAYAPEALHGGHLALQIGDYAHQQEIFPGIGRMGRAGRLGLRARPQLAGCTGAFPPDRLLVDQRRSAPFNHDAAVDDHEIDVTALGDVDEVAERVCVRREVGASKVEADEVGPLANLEASDLMIEPHGPGALEGRHPEDVVRLPEVGHCVLLEATDRERPAHDFDHVGVHIIGR